MLSPFVSKAAIQAKLLTWTVHRILPGMNSKILLFRGTHDRVLCQLLSSLLHVSLLLYRCLIHNRPQLSVLHPREGVTADVATKFAFSLWDEFHLVSLIPL